MYSMTSSELPEFFKLCHEIGLSGDTIHFFLASLDVDMEKAEAKAEKPPHSHKVKKYFETQVNTPFQGCSKLLSLITYKTDTNLNSTAQASAHVHLFQKASINEVTQI